MPAGSPSPAGITHDWDFAPIPTPPTPTRTTGVLIPLRWHHHGDLRILVDETAVHDVFVSAADLRTLAEYEEDADYPHPTLRPHVTWAKRPGAELLEFYPLADALAVIDHAPTHVTGDMVEWLREQLPLVLRDEVIDATIGLEDFLTSYTVAQAARILDADPAVSIGQRSLFEHLSHIGWAQRDLVGHWMPTRHATRQGLLTIRAIVIRPRTKQAAPYPQLYVTPAGLAELRRTLHALHPTTPSAPPPEQLPLT